jgi:hypothetical protein
LPPTDPDAAALHPGGWPLETPVDSRQLLAAASRVPGVLSVQDVLLASGSGQATDQVALHGLQLPRLERLSLVVGAPVPIEALRGQTTAPPSTASAVPLPVVPREC